MENNDSKYKKENVEALVEWAKSTTFPKEINLSDMEQVKDVARMVKAELADIEKRYKPGNLHPSVGRLYRLKAVMEGVAEK